MSGLKNLLVGIGIVALVLLVALGILEMAARIVFDSNGMHYGIEMWKYARQLKRQSAIHDMAHEHVPGGQARLMGVPVQINSLGLRDREFSTEKVEGVYRILVLGDSMTFGWGTAFEDTYPKVLQRMLNEAAGSQALRFEVINAGVGNYNTVQEVAYFKERGLELDPDMVILGFYINDAEPTPRAKTSLLSRCCYLYVVGSSAWDALERRHGVTKGYQDYYRDLYRDDAPGWRAARKALAELIELCRVRGIAFYILLIPELHSPAKQYPFESVHAKLQRIGVENGISVIEVRHAMGGIEPRDLWVSLGDAHPNGLAHELIAEELHAAISEDLLELGGRDARASRAGSADRESW